ncbi:MAG: c-type cytochrome [Bacteroidota bacterium]
MKKTFLSLALAALVASCGGGKTEKKEGDEVKNPEENNTEATDISANPDYQKGLALIAKSDCLTCHKVDEVITGPTYRDVANKYGGMPDTIVKHLAGKIISGGKGVWGEVFMTPHPAVSQEDAETMIRYILLLKNK